MKALRIFCLWALFFSFAILPAQKDFTAQDSALIKQLALRSDSFLNARRVEAAFSMLDSARKVADRTGSPRWKAYVINYRGSIYDYIGDVNSSLDCYNKAIKLYEQANHNEGLRWTWMNKGNTYFKSGEFQKAEQTYLIGLMSAKESGDKDFYADIYNNLGSVYGSTGKHEKAKEYFLKAKKIYEEAKDTVSIGYYYNNIANTCLEERDYPCALENMKIALRYKLHSSSPVEKANGYSNLASAFVKVKDFKNALINLQKSLELTDTAVYNVHLKNLYEEFAGCYEGMGNFQKAVYYYKKLQTINREVYRKDLSRQIDQRDLMSDLSRMHLTDSLSKVSQIEKQKLALEKSDAVKYFLAAIVLLIAVFSVLILRRYRISQQQQKEIRYQKHLVDMKQKEIVDSIMYAKRIQSAHMPRERYISKLLESLKLRGKGKTW